eukprot:tig00021281_g19922.t1
MAPFARCATIEIKSSKQAKKRSGHAGSGGSGRHSPTSSTGDSDWNSDLRRVESDPFFKGRKQASFRTQVLGGIGLVRSTRATQIAKHLAQLQKSGWGNAAARLQALEELFLLMEDGRGLSADEVVGEDTAAGIRSLCALAATGTDDDVVAGNQLVLRERAAALAVLVSMTSTPEAADFIMRLMPGSQLLDIGEGLSTEIEVHLAVELIRRFCQTEEFRFQFSNKPLLARIAKDVKRCASEALGPGWVGPLAIAAEMAQREKMQRSVVEAGLGHSAIEILRQHVASFADESPAELLVLQAGCALVAAHASQFEEEIWRPIAEGAPTIISLVKRHSELVQERGLTGAAPRSASATNASEKGAPSPTPTPRPDSKADEREMALRNEAAGYGLRALLDIARKGAVDPYLRTRAAEAAAFVRALVRLVSILEASRSWDHRPLASMVRQLIESLSSRDEAVAAVARDEAAALKGAEGRAPLQRVLSGGAGGSRLEPLGPSPAAGARPGVRSRRRSSVADQRQRAPGGGGAPAGAGVGSGGAGVGAGISSFSSSAFASVGAGAGAGARPRRNSGPHAHPARVQHAKKSAELSVPTLADPRAPSPGAAGGGGGAGPEGRGVVERVKSGLSSAFSSFKSSKSPSFRDTAGSPTAALSPVTPRGGGATTPRVKA